MAATRADGVVVVVLARRKLPVGVELATHKPAVDSEPPICATTMSNKCVQLIVRGRVTGVYFRASAQREAKRLGLTGWVKNRPDGCVELLAEGDEETVRELMSWAHHGPSAARVDGVDIRWRSYSGKFSDFRIIDS